MKAKKTEIEHVIGGLTAYRTHIKRKKFTLLIASLIVVLFIIISVNVGASNLNPWRVFQTLIGGVDEKASIIIWRIRMPRVVAAIVAGAGLSVSGCVMQNNLKNPLASPSTLGIASAATFGANLAIIVFGAGTVMNTVGNSISINNPYLVTICAFACSMLATFVILGLAKLRSFSPEAIILAGVAISSIFSAGTTIIQYFAPDVKIAAAVFWTFGDLGRISWDEVKILSAVVLAALIYFSFKRWDYNALANGEETARSLGVNTGRIRFFGLLVSSLITAVSVSFLGMIGFIGLIGPQIMIRIVGADYRFLIPSSALMGAILLLAADTVARTIISPIVLPVGAITSLLGGPMFLYMLLKGSSEKR